MEVIKQTTSKGKKSSEQGYFDIDEKLIAAAILILILILGIFSHFL